MERLTADSLLWNWARWSWAGDTVGNMVPYAPDDDDFRPINYDHARLVDAMHKALPHHEGMVITAEYPQKNVRFGHLNSEARVRAARRWISLVTGVHLTEHDYKLYLGFFKSEVERRVLG